MKLSDYTAPKGNILILGPPGTGKTTLLAMLTKRGFIVECDGNIKGPSNFLKNRGLTTEVEFAIPHIDDKGNVVSQGQRWDKMCEITNKALNSPDYDMVAIDSLLTFNDYAVDKVRLLNKKRVTTDLVPGEQISQPDWGTFYALVKHFLVSMKAGSKDKLTAVTAHIATDKDEMGGFLKYFVAIPGSLKEQIAGLFDEVWKLSSEEKNGKQVHYVQTAPGLREDALGLKSALNLGIKQEIDFAKLNELFTK